MAKNCGILVDLITFLLYYHYLILCKDASMRKVSKYFILLSIFLFSTIVDCSILNANCRQIPSAALSRSFAFYPKELENAATVLVRLPEAKQLLETINKEGPVGLILDPAAEAGAYWDSYNRRIGINLEMCRNDGVIINCILFELHNAANDKKLRNFTNLAAKGKISKEAYVEAIEKIEHENAVSASRLLRKGIEENIYPPQAKWSVFSSFEDHYLVQQLTGHSLFIAERYDQMNRGRKTTPFKGTFPEARSLPPEDKQTLMRYLSLKNDLESRDRDEIARATSYLMNEYAALDDCAKAKKTKGCEGHKRHLELMEQALKGNPVYEMIRQQTKKQSLPAQTS